ncbi:Cobalbumin biosynthesis enzyme [Shewanella piezotolerans WP3]|uniref:Bifunctional adenosylcobalamin biosynthesis protein n=1 Tax=Shewanella piezotolerans (strain WP3 / JCM 13877) TaxID=225849 RepID=B8CJ39_SHEPW|nr:bifunctional adenosylcobinamide kinase/adenosylcobinamide-phosphate guanylyltransferase [Shewanella piezotolerans]ACJ27801.1 Cobalbumin biosynthesis enzyme [Shewanella piezotolerans WP3]
MIHLVLGGARSGKSRFAEQLVANWQLNTPKAEYIYVATAQALDKEMQARIAHHKAQRQSAALGWQTIESPLHLSATLNKYANVNSVILVDCLTLWLTNHLLDEASDWRTVKADLLTSLESFPGQLILVSNEVGNGIVPMGELSRRFVDEAGWLHQDIAALADNVTLVTAGLPLSLKST